MASEDVTKAILMTQRISQRREALLPMLVSEGVEAFLVSSETNVSYLSEFTGDSSTLLLTRDRSLIISDGRYATQLQSECPDWDHHIRPVGQTMIPGVIDVVRKLGIKTLGMESTSVSVSEHLELKVGLETTEIKPVEGKVEALRMIKDDQEIAFTRQAVSTAERAFAMLRAGLRSNETEKDVTDNLETYLRRCGASSASFPPIVAVGKNAALPHYHGSDRTRVDDDEFILVDWGASAGPYRYKSDLTRVLVTGKVTPKFEEVYRLVLAAQERGIAAIRPGVTGREVDAEARSVIEEAGFGRFFEHGSGHGLGMDIHEAPRLRRESNTILQAGMIITMEPGVYLPGWGGVRIEDDILVTADGYEVLTSVPKALETLRAY
jgi:Xaa-Pro aminopeptidase